jgi:hypothetical protein
MSSDNTEGLRMLEIIIIDIFPDSGYCFIQAKIDPDIFGILFLKALLLLN